MAAMTQSRTRWRWLGGKSRASGPAADDADRPLELDPVRVDARVRGGGADQGADRVVGEQVAPDLLLHHVRRFGAQDLSRAAEVGLELLVPGLVLPSFVIGMREDGRRGVREVQDGGDQGDDLVLPVALAIGDLVLDDAHVPGVPRVQVPSGAGGFQERGPCLAPDLRVYQHGPVGAVWIELQRREREVGFHPPQERRAGVRGGAPVLPVIKVAVGDEQPVFPQVRVELARQGLLAAALGHTRADRGQHGRVRRALADRHRPGLGKRRRRVVLAGPGVPERRSVRLRIRDIPFQAVHAHLPPRAQERPRRVLRRHRPRDLGEHLSHGLMPEPLPRLRQPARRHHDVRRELPAFTLRGLPRRLDRLIDRVPRHPGRQHAQGDPVAQAALSHTASLRHNPRSCRQPAETPRSDTPGQIKILKLSGIGLTLHVYTLGTPRAFPDDWYELDDAVSVIIPGTTLYSSLIMTSRDEDYALSASVYQPSKLNNAGPGVLEFTVRRPWLVVTYTYLIAAMPFALLIGVFGIKYCRRGDEPRPFEVAFGVAATLVAILPLHAVLVPPSLPNTTRLDIYFGIGIAFLVASSVIWVIGTSADIPAQPPQAGGGEV